MEKGLWFKNYSLFACNQQLHVSQGAATTSWSHYKLKIKIVFSKTVELNHGLSCEAANQIMVLQETTYQSLQWPHRKLLCIYWHTALYLDMWSPKSVIVELLWTFVVNCTAGMPTPQLCSVVQWLVHWASSPLY